MAEWEVRVTIYRNNKRVGTADVMAGSFRDLMQQSISELADWGAANPEKVGGDHE